MSRAGIIITQHNVLSLAETFKVSRQIISDMDIPEPPWTYRELRHIYRAIRTNSGIVLRNTISEDE